VVSPGTLVSFTNKTDSHDIAEIVLKVALNTINHKTYNGRRTIRNFKQVKIATIVTLLQI
jgi:hypothetical protein